MFIGFFCLKIMLLICGGDFGFEALVLCPPLFEIMHLKVFFVFKRIVSVWCVRVCFVFSTPSLAKSNLNKNEEQLRE